MQTAETPRAPHRHNAAEAIPTDTIRHRLAATPHALIELGWLLALACVSLYFNPLSARHFEPDKILILRTIVLVMVGVAVGCSLGGLVSAAFSGDTGRSWHRVRNAWGGIANRWKHLFKTPLMLAAAAYVLVFLLTTATSVAPSVSFWGSYERLDGTYTHLSYVAIFVMLVAVARRIEQVERIASMIVLMGLIVASYGLVQWFGLDPFPWRSDVTSRVSSALGNPIFAGAFLAMVEPFPAARMVFAIREARRATPSADPQADLVRWLGPGFLVLGSCALFQAALQVLARAMPDLAAWWILPSAIVVVTAICVLAVLPDSSWAARSVVGVLFVSYVMLLAGAALVGPAQSSHALTLWLLAAILSISAAYILNASVTRQSERASRLAWRLRALGDGAITVVLVVTIVLTQSRGPWLGLAAGACTLVIFLLWRVGKQQSEETASREHRRTLLIWCGSLGTLLILAGLVLFLNLSRGPLAVTVRQLPYLGLATRLFDLQQGTGLERRLIWFGDEHAGGAIGLILEVPARTLLGWGPESMMVAYNRFYPPALAELVPEGSPDRSHQLWLDLLVTRGVLGLASYIILMGTVFVAGTRLLRDEIDPRILYLIAPSLAGVVAMLVTEQSGIPVAATTLLSWVLVGIVAVSGKFGRAARDARQTDNMDTMMNEPDRSGLVAAGRARSTAYVAVAVLIVVLSWRLNLQPAFADMRFQEGLLLGRSGPMEDRVAGLERLLVAVRNAPDQDAYLSGLSQAVAQLAATRRAQGEALGAFGPDVRLDMLLGQRGHRQVASFVHERSVQEMMGLANEALEHAHRLNPGSKDHSTNLTRLNVAWFRWTSDPLHLGHARHWSDVAVQIAPQDTVLLVGQAGVLLEQGQLAEGRGDRDGARSCYAEAIRVLERAHMLAQQRADLVDSLNQVRESLRRVE